MFFFFDIKKINTIDDIVLLHGDLQLYEENFYNINFKNFNIYELDNAFKDLDIKIISIKVNDLNKIGYTSSSKLIETYKNNLINQNLVEQGINSELRGFKIESMLILCTRNELEKLEKRVDII